MEVIPNPQEVPEPHVNKMKLPYSQPRTCKGLTQEKKTLLSLTLLVVFCFSEDFLVLFLDRNVALANLAALSSDTGWGIQEGA